MTYPEVWVAFDVCCVTLWSTQPLFGIAAHKLNHTDKRSTWKTDRQREVSTRPWCRTPPLHQPVRQKRQADRHQNYHTYMTALALPQLPRKCSHMQYFGPKPCIGVELFYAYFARNRLHQANANLPPLPGQSLANAHGRLLGKLQHFNTVQ